jgi:UDP-N-acetylenolpyruvoylglucosamine reductase
MDCAVIKLDGDFKEIRMIDSETVYCGAGATLAALCKFALNNSLSGLEFAWGIPGTVGGAVFMNNYAVSPSVYTAVCSNDILKLLDEPKTLEKCTEQIMILEKKDTDISSTLLKMNNNLNKSKKSLLYLPHISKNNGVTGEKVEIMIKK